MPAYLKSFARLTFWQTKAVVAEVSDKTTLEPDLRDAVCGTP